MKKKKKKRRLPYKVAENYPVRRRDKLITRNMIGKNYSVHNGKYYVTVSAVSIRLGTKLGDYSPTIITGNYPKKKNIPQKRKKK